MLSFRQYDDEVTVEGDTKILDDSERRHSKK